MGCDNISRYEKPFRVLMELDKKYGYLLKSDIDSFFKIVLKELAERCTGGWIDCPSLRVWVVNEIIEHRETKKERIKKKRTGCIRLGEGLVANWLYQHGWSPGRTNPNNESGIPDFKCSDNRWVEAKNLSYGHLDIALCQIKYWKQLLDKRDKVFLVLYDSKKEVIGTPPLDISIATLSDVTKLVDVVMESKGDENNNR